MSNLPYWKKYVANATKLPSKKLVKYYEARCLSYPKTKNARFTKSETIFCIRSTTTGKPIGVMYASVRENKVEGSWTVGRKNHGQTRGGVIYLAGSSKSEIV